MHMRTSIRRGRFGTFIKEIKCSISLEIYAYFGSL